MNKTEFIETIAMAGLFWGMGWYGIYGLSIVLYAYYGGTIL